MVPTNSDWKFRFGSAAIFWGSVGAWHMAFLLCCDEPGAWGGAMVLCVVLFKASVVRGAAGGVRSQSLALFRRDAARVERRGLGDHGSGLSIRSLLYLPTGRARRHRGREVKV
jgi:hypothetical protein